MAHEIIGHHGTVLSAAESISNGEILPGDWNGRWLGSGLYFFEDNLTAAIGWAKEVAQQRKSEKPELAGFDVVPAVVTARIDLTTCLDICEQNFQKVLRLAHRRIREDRIAQGEPPLTQEALTIRDGEIWAGYKGKYKGFGSNRLDYAVVDNACEIMRDKYNIVPTSIRCVFIEGEEIYERSWFFSGSHRAIVVRPPFLGMEVEDVMKC